MRVAVDVTPLIGQRTGIGVLTAGVLQELASRQVCTLRGYAVTWRGRDELAAELPAGVKPLRLPMAARPLQWAWGRFDGPVIEWWSGPVDVVHGTNFVVPPAAKAAEVVSIHDASFVRLPQFVEPASLRYPAIIRRAVARGAWVQVLSHAMAGEIAECFGVSPERVRVVSPGVGTGSSTWSPSPAGPGETPRPARPTDATPAPSPPAAGAEAPLRPRAGGIANGGRPYVLALGRTEPRKDLGLLVEAFDQLAATRPDLDLVIAGPPGWAEGALQGAVRRARHREWIRRLGWVDDDEKGRLLRGAAAFAYPSVYEGFGIPPLEAMAAGVPVVATDAGGIPEAVGDGAVLVPVGDRDALAAALGRVLDDTALRARLVTAGRARVEYFSWRRCADGLYALYQDAAASRSCAR